MFKGIDNENTIHKLNWHIHNTYDRKGRYYHDDGGKREFKELYIHEIVSGFEDGEIVITIYGDAVDSETHEIIKIYDDVFISIYDLLDKTIEVENDDGMEGYNVR